MTPCHALFHVKHEPRMHQASRRPVSSGGGLRTELGLLRVQVPRAQQTLCSRTANTLRHPTPNTPREIGWTTTPVIRQRHSRRRAGGGAGHRALPPASAPAPAPAILTTCGDPLQVRRDQEGPTRASRTSVGLRPTRAHHPGRSPLPPRHFT